MPDPLRVLVVVSRPIAASITFGEGHEEFEAIAPVPVPLWQPMKRTRD